MAEAATTTRPTRSRTSKPAAAKAAPAKAAAPAPAAEPTKTNVDRFKVELEHVGATKQYEKFAAPESMKGVVVGNMYGPLGTQRMIVLVVGAGDNGEDE